MLTNTIYWRDTTHFDSEDDLTPQGVEMSVTVNNNSPIQDYLHPDDHTQPIYISLAFIFIFQGIKPYLAGLLSVYKIHCPNLVTIAMPASNKVPSVHPPTLDTIMKELSVPTVHVTGVLTGVLVLLLISRFK